MAALIDHDVLDAVVRNNANVGGAYIEHGSEQYLLRGIGLVTPESAPDDVPGGFAFDLLDDVAGPTWSDGALAVVVAPDGAFAELPFAPY